MNSKKDIILQIQELADFRLLVRAYEQIASMRMMRTRETVLTNRKYLEDIENIFEKVRRSYIEQVKKIAKKRKTAGEDTITFLSHNGKKVAILLSANSGLYGSILEATFDKFISEVKQNDIEVTLVGRHGLGLFESELPNKPYTFFQIPDENITSKDLDPIIRHVVQYEEIHIYYGKFINVVFQKPDVLTISAQISLELQGKADKVSYLFEPSLEKILMFFETQIFGATFEQAARESELAKYASRVMAMDAADENVSQALKKHYLEKLKITHRETNRKQINTFASVSMWK